MSERIVIEQVPNSDLLVFHATVELSAVSDADFWRPLEKWQEEKLKQVGDAGEKLARTILAIKGVNALGLRIYTARVEKGSAFGWENIRPQVVSAILTVFEAKGVPKTDVEVQERDSSIYSLGSLLDPFRAV